MVSTTSAAHIRKSMLPIASIARPPVREDVDRAQPIRGLCVSSHRPSPSAAPSRSPAWSSTRQEKRTELQLGWRHPIEGGWSLSPECASNASSGKLTPSMTGPTFHHRDGAARVVPSRWRAARSFAHRFPGDWTARAYLPVAVVHLETCSQTSWRTRASNAIGTSPGNDASSCRRTCAGHAKKHRQRGCCATV